MTQYHRYRMDFESKWVRWSATCAGAAVFLLVLHYVVMEYLEMPGSLIWDLWIPLSLGVIYIVLLRGFRLNAPGVYAILGALICIWLLIGVYGTGSMLRSILATVGYLFCGGVLILCTGGWLPGRLPAAVCFAILLGIRVVLFDLGRIAVDGWLTTLTDWGFLASLVCLPMAMVPGNQKK